MLTDWPACAGGELSVYTKFCTPSKVEVRARGNERIITPLGQTWDYFFIGGSPVSDDFLNERTSQNQAKREPL